MKSEEVRKQEQKDRLKRFKDAALEWANYIRKNEGKKALKHLPRGKRSRVTMCPLAKATGYNIGGTRPDAVHVFGDVSNFVGAFDRGEYPELIERRKG